MSAGAAELTPPAGERIAAKAEDLAPLRHECKYWFPGHRLPELRRKLAPFCCRDPYGDGLHPSYPSMTMQFDTPGLSFFRSHIENALTRFKLRARCYEPEEGGQVTLEVKGKLEGKVLKQRCRIPFEHFRPGFESRQPDELGIKGDRDITGFEAFARLMKESGARPILSIRYQREAYFSHVDDYARVTVDTDLRYRRIVHWDDWHRPGRWRPIHTEGIGGLPPHPVVLELKADDHFPVWMHELITHFDLERRSICKYAMAINTERRALPEEGP